MRLAANVDRGAEDSFFARLHDSLVVRLLVVVAEDMEQPVEDHVSELLAGGEADLLALSRHGLH